MSNKEYYKNESAFEGIKEFLAIDGEWYQAHEKGCGQYGIYTKTDDCWIFQFYIWIKVSSKNNLCQKIYRKIVEKQGNFNEEED